MQRWQGAALAVVLCAGCLDPLVGDEPGYSRYVMPPGSTVPNAYVDVQINRKIDVNDGATMPAVALKKGFAAGQEVQYWDFGVAKRAAAPAYGIRKCDGSEPLQHPVIVDNIPGDSDYSAYRAIAWACTTSKYKGEIIPSLDAFNDAIDLGLIVDPGTMGTTAWVNHPIVAPNVAGGLMSGPMTSVAYYKGTQVLFYDLEPVEGAFLYDGMPVKTGNVYEIMKPGSMAPARVIFSQPWRDPVNPAMRNPLYTPSWLVVTVTAKAPSDPMMTIDSVIESLKSESDLVTVGMNNALTVVNPSKVASAVVTTNRVNRPFVLLEQGVAAP